MKISWFLGSTSKGWESFLKNSHIIPVIPPSTFQMHSSSSESTDTFEGLVDEFQDVFKENPDCLTPMLTEPMRIHLRRDAPGYKPLRVTVARKTPKHFQEAKKLRSLLIILCHRVSLSRCQPQSILNGVPLVSLCRNREDWFV